MTAEVAGEVHARRHQGEVVVNPDSVEDFFSRTDLRPPHPEYGGVPAEVEVRSATLEENPPNGALWLTAVDARVSLRADPAEVIRVLHEAGILDRLRARGDVPGL